MHISQKGSSTMCLQHADGTDFLGCTSKNAVLTLGGGGRGGGRGKAVQLTSKGNDSITL